MSKPIVSICCLTYNHAPFIRQCLDGFLMQKLQAPSVSPKGGETGPNSVPFGEGREGAGPLFEILIHDDCSTDGTTEIVKEYAAKYPNIIFPLYESINQFTNPDRTELLDFFNYRRARGKYIATCEGDDYWTDPLKLQKQVEFMEANPEYSLCYHGADVHVCVTNEWRKAVLPEEFDLSASGFLMEDKFTLPLTMMFRMTNFSFEWSKHYTRYLDTMEIYHLLKEGKGRYLNFIGGVYNVHGGGISSSMSNKTRSWENVRDGYEMYHCIGDKATKEMYIKSIFWRLDQCTSLERKQTYCYVFKHTPVIGIKVWLTELKRKIKKTLHK